jgi:hypothetical protein
MSGGAARTLTRPACLRRARKGLVSRAGGSLLCEISQIWDRGGAQARRGHCADVMAVAHALGTLEASRHVEDRDSAR